tara:strand:+ start:179126 stop:180049 length:924 start_codon:yes stop_codon:yes gene_type:complete
MSEERSNIARICSLPQGRARLSAGPMAQTAMVALMVSALAACSAVPDTMKPDAIYGEGGSSAPVEDKGFPQLADTPEKAPDSTSARQQKSIAESLAEDRAESRSGDEALRQGVEPQSSNKGYSPELEARAETAAPPAALEDIAPPARMVAEAPAASAPVAAEPVAPEPAARVAEVQPAPQPVAATPAPVVAPAPVAAKAPPPPVAEVTEEEDVTPEYVAPAKMAAVESSRPALVIPPKPRIDPVTGLIPMPDRGGHKSYAEVVAAQRGEGFDEEVEDAPPAKAPEIPEEAPVTAAPTVPVEVNPAGL